MMESKDEKKGQEKKIEDAEKTQVKWDLSKKDKAFLRSCNINPS